MNKEEKRIMDMQKTYGLTYKQAWTFYQVMVKERGQRKLAKEIGISYGALADRLRRATEKLGWKRGEEKWKTK